MHNGDSEPYGHLTNTATSPDDPFFYIHHSFIDIFCALWQSYNDCEGDNKADNHDCYGSGTPADKMGKKKHIFGAQNEDD